MSDYDETTQGLMNVRALEKRADIAGLLEALKSPVEDGRLTVRGAAIDALGRLRTPEAVEPLAALLRDDPDPAVRAGAAVAISKLESDTRTDHLLAALEDSAPPVRWQAAFNLGRTGDARAVGALTALLRSDDVILRRAAAAGLGGIGDSRVQDALVAARDADTFWHRRIYNKAIRSVNRGATGRAD